MKTNPFQYFSRRPILTGLVMFFILMLLTQYLSYERYLLLQETEEHELLNEANSTQDRLQNAISYSRSTAQTLGFIVELMECPIILTAWVMRCYNQINLLMPYSWFKIV